MGPDAARDPAIEALTARAQELLRIGDLDEAIAVCESLGGHLQSGAGLDGASGAAAVLLSTANAASVPRPDAALGLLDILATLLAGVTDPTGRQLAALALFGKATILGRLGREREATDAFERLAGYGEDALAALEARDPQGRDLTTRVAEIVSVKATVLGRLGRRDEAVALIDECLSAGPQPEPVVAVLGELRSEIAAGG